jgi:hypothetical protein
METVVGKTNGGQREDTFAYIFEVGDHPIGLIKARLGEHVDASERRLVGHAPILRSDEYSPEPWKLYTRITLTASDQRTATVQAVSFSVERGVITVLRPGDLLHFSRDASGLGLSIVRGGYLVAAAGAVETLCKMPLGADVEVRCPGADLEARFFAQPDAFHYFFGGAAPRGKPLVEVVAAGETRIMPWGRPQIGPYEFLVRPSGMRPSHLYMSVELTRVCPETAAHTSAQLLDREMPTITPW